MDQHNAAPRAGRAPTQSDRRARRRITTLAVCLLLGAAVLAGCSSSPKKGVGASSNSGKTTTSAPPGPTVPPGSVPVDTTTTLPQAGGASAATCKKSQLAIAQVARGITAGDDTAVYAVSNTSGTRCTLSGYPTLSVFGSLGPLTTNVTNGGVAGGSKLTQSVVSLASHGGQASFAASWNPTATAAEPSCPDGQGVVITLPGVTGGFTINAFITACGGDINVSPMQPNVVTV
jgi:hypothetical protein